MNTPRWESVPDRVAAILKRINDDDEHAEDRRKVIAAIVAVADDEVGHVDPNLVRERLGDVDDPHVIGATYYALKRARVLVFAGWTFSDDLKGGNSGKPARIYRLVGWSDCSQ